MLCPTSTNFEVLGNVFSSSRSYFEIDVSRCVNDTIPDVICKTDTEIDQIIDEFSLGITLVNTYYDFDDYDEPVKTYLDDKYFYSTLSAYTKEVDVYIRENEVEV